MSETQATETTQNGHAMPATPLARITMTPTIGKLLAALAIAQGKYRPIPKNRTVKVKSKSTGAEYEFDYATLDQVLASTRPALSEQGIAFVQIVTGGGDAAWQVTTIIALGEERVESVTQLPGDFDGPQALGSYITYIRRYTAVALLGVVADEDDDGNAAEGNDVEKRERTPPPRDYSKDPPREAAKAAQPAPAAPAGDDGEAPSEDELAALERIIFTELKWAKQRARNWLQKHAGIGDPDALTKRQVGDLTALAEAFKASAAAGDDGIYDAKVAELAAAGRIRKAA